MKWHIQNSSCLKKLSEAVNENKKYYKCDYCDIFFLETCYLKNHIKTTHVNQININSDFCEKSLSKAKSLKRHDKKEFVQKDSIFSICKTMEPTKSALKLKDCKQCQVYLIRLNLSLKEIHKHIK